MDVATLTGAISSALGRVCTGAFGNDQDFTDQVVSAGSEVGERMWQLPTYDDYKEQFRSDVADIKNTGGGAFRRLHNRGDDHRRVRGRRPPGCTWTSPPRPRRTKPRRYNPKGASGVPVRTLVTLARKLAASPSSSD